MSLEYHHLDKWAFANLDLVEEALESNKKPAVLISGASSSGKSYSAAFLEKFLAKNGHRAITISLDQYNVGLSHIIPNKVRDNYFDGHIEHLSEIEEIIKKIIYDVPFDKKYDQNVLKDIRKAVESYFSKEDLDKFINALYAEWKVLNFDEPTVYDLQEAAEDVKILLSGGSIQTKKYSKVVSERVPSDETVSGNDYDVILIEGIYALDPTLVDALRDVYTIKDFIDGNPKSLFLRRIIRDAMTTSADNVFTISIYFQYIVKSYYESIYPCRMNADVILNNDMTFTEMKSGNLYTTKQELHTYSKEKFDKILSQCQILDEIYQKDVYFSCEDEKNKNDNILRFRLISEDGKHYTPSSLVHKGIPKVRRDDKIIRPINVLLNEKQLIKVWDNENDCLDDFLRAGFRIGPVRFKKKILVIYHNRRLTLREVKDDGYYVEFTQEPNEETSKEIKELFND